VKAMGEISKAAGELTKAAGAELASAGITREAAGAAAKTAAKKAGSAIRTAGKTVKEAGKQVASAVIPEVYVEMNGRQYVCADTVERCKADFRASHAGAVRSCRVYIKPEDGMAYYVINGIEGKVAL